ncbi:MAG: four helix bundle protein [Bacteroidota bacterium]
MRDFTRYEIWQDGISLTKEIYLLCKTFPDSEKFGLISQMTRAAISIPSNFAEGCSRSSEKEFTRFIEIALGSSFELKTQLLIAIELAYCKSSEKERILSRIDKICKQLNTLRNKLK